MLLLRPLDLSRPYRLLRVVLPLRPPRSGRQSPRRLPRALPILRFRPLSPLSRLPPDLSPRQTRLRDRPRRLRSRRTLRPAGIPRYAAHGDAEPPKTLPSPHFRAPFAPPRRGFPGFPLRGASAGGERAAGEAERASSRVHGAAIRAGSGGNAVVRNRSGVLAGVSAQRRRGGVSRSGAVRAGESEGGRLRGGAERAVELVRRAVIASMQRNRGDEAGPRAAPGLLHRGTFTLRETPRGGRSRGERRCERPAGRPRDRGVVDAAGERNGEL